ncbi:acid protease [Gyrodon lividus]|nr:acid protease [Gyrodon lividus]
MRFTLATVIAALLFFVAAVPQPTKQGGKTIPLLERSSVVNADNSVNFEALNSHVASTTAKIFRSFDNFEKNTGTLHPSAMKGPQKRGSGGAPLSYSSSTWYGIIGVGTPAMLFDVVFDTGSSDLILPGPDCDESCDGHNSYYPEDSDTSIDLEDLFSIIYLDGSNGVGELFSDVVSVAGLEAFGQTIGAALHYSQSLESHKFPADGFMGMAFQSASSYDASPVFQTLISNDETDQPVFAFSFVAPGPELYLGGTNPAMYTGDFTYVDVTAPGLWQINIDDIVVNGQSLLTNIAAIIDTGTILIYGHPSDVATLYAAVDATDASETLGYGYWTFPCEDIPSVSFTIGDTSFPISSGNLNLGHAVEGSNECIGSIIGRDFGESTWLIGTAFLSNVYTAFDVGEMRVGFATPALDSPPHPSSAPSSV